MKKVILTIAMTIGMMATAMSQEQNQTITMKMVPTYSVNVTDTQIKIATTFPIDVYVNDIMYSITVPGFHTINIEAKSSRILVLQHQEF